MGRIFSGRGPLPTTYLGYTPTIYAAPADVGNGSGSSEANAMDLATALTNAVAGDIVGLIPGVYSRQSPGGMGRFNVAWNPTNSGSSGNPIRFVAKYAAVAYQSNSSLWTEMQADLISGGYGSPAFGSQGRDYIEWLGVYASDESGHSASADDTSVCVLSSADHCVVQYCLIRGDGAKWGANNYHGVTCEDCVNPTVSYNDIRNYYTGSVGATNANGCGVMLDHTAGGLVEHNTFTDCGAAVFHKRADASGGGSYNHGNWIVRFNRVIDCQFGIRFDSNHSTGETTWTVNVYQNLITGTALALCIGNSSSDLVGKVRFQNNTIASATGSHDAPLALLLHPSAGQGFGYWNNIFSVGEHGVYKEASGTAWDDTALDSQHNVWHSNSGAFWYQDGPTYTYTNWTDNGMEGDSPASITSDPLFTNAAGGIYTLQAGSPARDLGVDLLDLQGGGTSASIHAGCYVTGLETIGTGY